MSASEQTSDSKRTDGYYRVKLHGSWEIMQWLNGHWWVLSAEEFLGQQQVRKLEIDERLIDMPDKNIHPDVFEKAVAFLMDQYNAPEFEDKRDELHASWESLANTMILYANSGQPDELSKAQERVKELEKALKDIRALGGLGSTHVIVKRMFEILQKTLHD